MRRVIVSLILLFSLVPAYPQDVKPYLRIETVSHTAKVVRIDVDAAEQFLVSASEDKTARVWDLHSGKLLQILRPPIGDGEEGKLYAVAISPDGKTVAVGGFTGANGSGNNPIYIFDRATGTIRKVIPGLPNVALHLAYSPDSRNLAVALFGENGIRIYDTQAYAEVGRDTDYADSSYWVEFDTAGRLVSVCDDGYVRLYDPGFHLVKKQRSPGAKDPMSARFSPDGNYIAVGFYDSSRVDVLLAKDLSLQYSAQAASSGGLEWASWSADGRTLCAAGGYAVDRVSPVLCWSNAGRGALRSFLGAADSVMGIRALRDGGMAFAVGDGTVGLLAPGGVVKWRATPEVLDYRYRLFGAPANPWISSDGNTVESRGNYFNGTEWTNHIIRFSVQERKLEIDPQADSSLSSPETKGLDVKDSVDKTSPTLDGKPLKLKPYETSRSLAIAPKRDGFVLGAEWHIYRFDQHGAQIWPIAVPSVAWGVNISHDGRFVVATLGDGTIRWYNFDTGKEVLALFIDRDLKRWVAWNPDGFFTFDGQGADSLIGYQINRGPDHACDFVKVDQLREVFYRSDLIAQILQPGGVEAASAARNRVGDISRILSSGLPPQIELVSVSPANEPDKYLVQFRVKDLGGGTGRIVYRIDGVEIEARDAVDIKGSGANTINRYITVGSGQHTLAIAGRSANGKIEGAPTTAQLTGRQPAAGNKVSLYVVAAGISHYSDHSLDQGVKFAAADADAVAARFQDQAGKGLYQQVKAVALPDSRATAENIRKAVAQAAAAISPGDTFVLYLAGHGTAVDGEYYFIPWEAEYTNQKELLAKSLNREAIQALLKQIHTNKTVLILDTCGSGAYLEARATGVSEKAAVEKLATMSGRAVIAASNSDEMAMDGYQNHGVFTFALLQGLQTAGSDAAGNISVADLSKFVQRRVPDITVEKWHYKQTPLSLIVGDFPIVYRLPN